MEKGEKGGCISKLSRPDCHLGANRELKNTGTLMHTINKKGKPLLNTPLEGQGTGTDLISFRFILKETWIF